MRTSRYKSRAAIVGAVYPDFKLTDKQWNEIARLGEFPASAADEAQPMIEAAIRNHRLRKQRRAAAMLPADVHKELMAISAAVWDLQERLRSVEQSQPVDMVLSFTKEKETLRLLEGRVSLLAGDIERGAKDRDAYYLVRVLDGILRECTGKPIMRSRKRTDNSHEYIKAVCRVADPDIGDGTIERAMKDCIKHRPQRVD
jgi:hypothetical protein